MSNYSKGEVVLVRYPFSDLSRANQGWAGLWRSRPARTGRWNPPKPSLWRTLRLSSELGLPELRSIKTPRHPGVSEEVCRAYSQAAEVCLGRHHTPPVTLLRVECKGRDPSRFLGWWAADETAQRAWRNRDDATRDGAYVVSLAVVEAELGMVALSRADTRSGADYYIGAPGSRDLEEASRLEVSGLDEGNRTEMRRRLRDKESKRREDIASCRLTPALWASGRPPSWSVMLRGRSMNDQHATAQDLSIRAAALLGEGYLQQATDLFAEAARYEEGALASIPPGNTRTRSVLSVSLASLLYKGGRLDEAERAIFRCLGPGDLDCWAEAQLRELLSVVADERLLIANLHRYSGQDIMIALRGGEIGSGSGPLDLILEKTAGFRSLLYRVAEWAGQYPFRSQGPPPSDLRNLIEARAIEPAAGSYKLEVRLAEPIQRDVFEPVRVPATEVVERLFGFLKGLTEGTRDDLEHLVPEPNYRKALLQLTRNILPAGRRLREIGIYRKNDDELQSVYLTGSVSPRIREAIPRDTPNLGGDQSYRGTLRAVHLDKNWLSVILPDGKQLRFSTPPEMLDDVVGPMVNKQVVVTGGKRSGKSQPIVSEIELADED
jgi:hypothetical protein